LPDIQTSSLVSKNSSVVKIADLLVLHPESEQNEAGGTAVNFNEVSPELATVDGSILLSFKSQVPSLTH
jgi:hypothetical protein